MWNYGRRKVFIRVDGKKLFFFSNLEMEGECGEEIGNILNIE